MPAADFRESGIARRGGILKYGGGVGAGGAEDTFLVETFFRFSGR